MSSPARIALLKEALSLEQQRAALQARIERIAREISATRGAPIPSPNHAAAKKAAPAPAPARRRAAPGELRWRVCRALSAAGKGGLRVRDLVKPTRTSLEALNSWFQYARKTVKVIRRIGRGRYALVGPLPPPPTPKSAKPKQSPGHDRGQLSALVHAALKAAGTDGARVADMAKKFGMPPSSLFVWFSTTAKNFKSIVKAGPGRYRLEG